MTILKHIKSIGILLGGMLLLGASTKPMTEIKLIKGETDQVREIVDGDTLFLASGLKVRLSGIQAPKLSLGRDHVTDWPLGHEAKMALRELALGQSVSLFYGGERRDRYERALAQLYVGDDQSGVYLQEEMLRRGLARVYTWPDTFQNSAILLAAEYEARESKRGIWALDYYDIRSPEPNRLAQDVDSFQIVEGVITSVAEIRGRIYLNFGADYKTDFTVVIDKENRKAFEGTGYELLGLEGAKVRVRGWIELKNGPSIWLTHSTPLELLDKL